MVAVLLKWIFNAVSSLTNSEIQKDHKNEPRFNDGYSRDNLPKINKAGEGALATRQGRGIVRASYGSCSSKMNF